MSGIKHDQQKIDYTHIPKEAMDAMGEAFTYGAKKYSADNYRQGMAVRRSIAAALRDIDKESGCKHIGSALASLAMAAYTVERKPEFDDRYRPITQSEERQDEASTINELARKELLRRYNEE
jgi:hypothetical protein